MEVAIVISLTVCFLAILIGRWFNPIVNEEIVDKKTHTFMEDGSYYYTEYWIKRTFRNGAVKLVKKKQINLFVNGNNSYNLRNYSSYSLYGNEVSESIYRNYRKRNFGLWCLR